MRIAAVVAIFAGMTAFLLAVTTPSPPPTTAEFTALTAPAEALLGERLATHGSVSLPDASVRIHRIRLCHVEKGNCTTAGWSTVSGPGHWSGNAGQVTASEPGIHRMTWTLQEPWTTDSTRAATRIEAEVTVLAPAE